MVDFIDDSGGSDLTQTVEIIAKEVGDKTDELVNTLNEALKSKKIEITAELSPESIAYLNNLTGKVTLDVINKEEIANLVDSAVKQVASKPLEVKITPIIDTNDLAITVGVDPKSIDQIKNLEVETIKVKSGISAGAVSVAGKFDKTQLQSALSEVAGTFEEKDTSMLKIPVGINPDRTILNNSLSAFVSEYNNDIRATPKTVVRVPVDIEAGDMGVKNVTSLINNVNAATDSVNKYTDSLIDAKTAGVADIIEAGKAFKTEYEKQIDVQVHFSTTEQLISKSIDAIEKKLESFTKKNKRPVMKVTFMADDNINLVDLMNKVINSAGVLNVRGLKYGVQEPTKQKPTVAKPSNNEKGEPIKTQKSQKTKTAEDIIRERFAKQGVSNPDESLVKELAAGVTKKEIEAANKPAPAASKPTPTIPKWKPNTEIKYAPVDYEIPAMNTEFTGMRFNPYHYDKINSSDIGAKHFGVPNYPASGEIEGYGHIPNYQTTHEKDRNKLLDVHYSSYRQGLGHGNIKSLIPNIDSAKYGMGGNFNRVVDAEVPDEIKDWLNTIQFPSYEDYLATIDIYKHLSEAGALDVDKFKSEIEEAARKMSLFPQLELKNVPVEEDSSFAGQIIPSESKSKGVESIGKVMEDWSKKVEDYVTSSEGLNASMSGEYGKFVSYMTSLPYNSLDEAKKILDMAFKDLKDNDDVGILKGIYSQMVKDNLGKNTYRTSNPLYKIFKDLGGKDNFIENRADIVTNYEGMDFKKNFSIEYPNEFENQYASRLMSAIMQMDPHYNYGDLYKLAADYYNYTKTNGLSKKTISLPKIKGNESLRGVSKEKGDFSDIAKKEAEAVQDKYPLVGAAKIEVPESKPVKAPELVENDVTKTELNGILTQEQYVNEYLNRKTKKGRDNYVRDIKEINRKIAETPIEEVTKTHTIHADQLKVEQSVYDEIENLTQERLSKYKNSGYNDERETLTNNIIQKIDDIPFYNVEERRDAYTGLVRVVEENLKSKSDKFEKELEGYYNKVVQSQNELTGAKPNKVFHIPTEMVTEKGYKATDESIDENLDKLRGMESQFPSKDLFNYTVTRYKEYLSKIKNFNPEKHTQVIQNRLNRLNDKGYKYQTKEMQGYQLTSKERRLYYPKNKSTQIKGPDVNDKYYKDPSAFPLSDVIWKQGLLDESSTIPANLSRNGFKDIVKMIEESPFDDESKAEMLEQLKGYARLFPVGSHHKERGGGVTAALYGFREALEAKIKHINDEPVDTEELTEVFEGTAYTPPRREKLMPAEEGEEANGGVQYELDASQIQATPLTLDFTPLFDKLTEIANKITTQAVPTVAGTISNLIDYTTKFDTIISILNTLKNRKYKFTIKGGTIENVEPAQTTTSKKNQKPAQQTKAVPPAPQQATQKPAPPAPQSNLPAVRQPHGFTLVGGVTPVTKQNPPIQLGGIQSSPGSLVVVQQAGLSSTQAPPATGLQAPAGSLAGANTNANGVGSYMGGSGSANTGVGSYTGGTGGNNGVGSYIGGFGGGGGGNTSSSTTAAPAPTNTFDDMIRYLRSKKPELSEDAAEQLENLIADIESKHAMGLVESEGMLFDKAISLIRSNIKKIGVTGNKSAIDFGRVSAEQELIGDDNSHAAELNYVAEAIKNAPDRTDVGADLQALFKKLLKKALEEELYASTEVVNKKLEEMGTYNDPRVKSLQTFIEANRDNPKMVAAGISEFDSFVKSEATKKAHEAFEAGATAPLPKAPNRFGLTDKEVENFQSEMRMLDLIKAKFGELSKEYKTAYDLFSKLPASMGGVGNKGTKDKERYYKHYNTVMFPEEEKESKTKSLLRKSLANMAGSIPKELGKLLVSGINKIKDLYIKTVKKAISISIKPFTKSVNMFMGAIKKAGGKSKTLSSISELLITPLVLATEYTLLPVLTKLIPSIKDVINWVVQSKDKFTLFGKAIANVVNEVYTLITSKFIYGFEDFFNKLKEKKDVIEETYNKVDGFFTQLQESGISMSEIGENLSGVKTVVDNISDAFNDFARNENGQLTFITDFATSMATAIIDSITDTEKGIASFLKQQSTVDAVEELMEKVINGLFTSFKITSDVIGDLIGQFADAFGKILESDGPGGLLSEITSNVNKIMKGILTVIGNALKDPEVIGLIANVLATLAPIWLSALAVKEGAGIVSDYAEGYVMGKGFKKAVEGATATTVAESVMTASGKAAAEAAAGTTTMLLGTAATTAIGGYAVDQVIEDALIKQGLDKEGKMTVSEDGAVRKVQSTGSGFMDVADYAIGAGVNNDMQMALKYGWVTEEDYNKFLKDTYGDKDSILNRLLSGERVKAASLDLFGNRYGEATPETEFDKKLLEAVFSDIDKYTTQNGFGEWISGSRYLDMTNPELVSLIDEMKSKVDSVENVMTKGEQEQPVMVSVYNNTKVDKDGTVYTDTTYKTNSPLTEFHANNMGV